MPATMAAADVQLSGMMPGNFWPGFHVLPPAPVAEEDAEEDADEDDEEGFAEPPVQRRPAARARGGLMRPAAANSRLSTVSGEGEGLSTVGDGADAGAVETLMRPAARAILKRKSSNDMDAPEEGQGEKTYGCSRCLKRPKGCATCRKPNFKPRGPRRRAGGASPAAPAAR